MQLKTILTIASFVGITFTAPVANEVMRSTEDKAVINSRFGAYEFDEKKRDEKAVINSRFGAYEFDDKKRDSDKAVINSRFRSLRVRREKERRGQGLDQLTFWSL
ncbi:hypothetical protein ABVK25_011479 [Lepraria finkii]|uniref:Uncharacterized protein n=1 Tax=Lepraria finkii TaxID=1340010 RepID=A0ABR4AP42_9LECA